MKNKRNSKEIQRNTRLEIRMSKEEKELWYEYAKDLGVSPSRLARNILMMDAESKINKVIGKQVIKAYKYYLEATNQKEEIIKIENDK